MMKKIATLAALALLAGCGVSRIDARDAATDRACNRYEKCGRIGAGETYTSRDDCEVQQRNFWNNYWPTDVCEDRINTDSLDLCLKSIDSTSCSSDFDMVSTAIKCSKDTVCTGG